MIAAAVAVGDFHLAPDLGQGCAEEAEWLALLHALRVAKARGFDDVILLGDCASVIAAAAGRSKCRSAAMQAHLAAFEAEAKEFARVRLRHVRRTQNLAGIALDRMRA